MKARALKPNDRVGLVAPGARPESAAAVAYAVRVVQEMGFRAVVGEHVLDAHGHLAGNDNQRLSDLDKFIQDESIAGIFCVTGGFGALPLLARLDYDAIKDKPKLFIGSDDNVALLIAVNKVCSLPVVLGPNLDRVRTAESFSSLKTAVTDTTPITVRCKSDRLGDNIEIPSGYSSFTGVRTGTVMGGSLTGLISLMGTQFQLEFDDIILYLDDYNERFDILDRWFTTLYVSGSLDKVAATIFGDISSCGSRGNESVLALEDLFGERLKQLRKPNLFGFGMGHNKTSPSIPLGVRARFDTTNSALEFESAAVE
ncbi:MAG TPA: LD-carboxypeptidase [Planktothrix sp.]